MHFTAIISIASALIFPLTSASAIPDTDNLHPRSVFTKLSLLNVVNRKAEYNKLPATGQNAFWVGKLEAFKHWQLSSLNGAQVHALDKAIALAAGFPSLESEPEVRRAMTEAFGYNKTRILLTTLESGNDGEEEDGDDPEKRAVGCNCSTISDWCGLFKSCYGGADCSPKNGCGTGWQYRCVGMCGHWV